MMSEETLEAQEPRTSNLGVAVTVSEKRLVDLVALKAGCGVSQLIREHSVNDLIERGRRMLRQIESADTLPT